MESGMHRSGVLHSFTGQGRLVVGEGAEVGVRFCVVQHIDSSIVAHCDLLAHISAESDWLFEPVELRGYTNEGMPVTMRNAQVGRMTSSAPVAERTQCRIVLEGGLLTVGEPTSASSPTLHFYLTNLEFGGSTFVSAERRDGLHSVQRVLHCLPVTVGGVEVEIKWAFDYMENLRLAQKRSGIVATAELSLALAAVGELEGARELADDICLLLSLARGTRVAAISCEARDESGAMLHFAGRRVPEKRFGFQSPEKLAPHWPLGTERFLEHAYPYVAAAKEQWAFDKAIDMYLDAKRQGDEFEFWGLKMVVCMEFLYARYVARVGEQSILEPGQFSNKVQQNIRRHLKTAICEAIDGVTKEQLSAMLGRIKGLNRPSFGDSLLKLNKRVDARISAAATRRFVKIRNSLVHRGTYEDEAKYGSPATQYSFLDDYVGRFLHALVGNPLLEAYRGFTWSDGRAVSEIHAHDLQ